MSSQFSAKASTLEGRIIEPSVWLKSALRYWYKPTLAFLPQRWLLLERMELQFLPRPAPAEVKIIGADDIEDCALSAS